MDDEPFVTRVVLLSLDFNFTAKPARRTSRHPFLTQVRPVENSTDFRLDTTEHVHENRGQGDDAGLVILRFVESDGSTTKVDLSPLDLERLTQSNAVVIQERDERAEMRGQ